MNKEFFFLLILLTSFFVNCSSSGDDDSAISVPQEIFGNWSPEFTDQTSSFTQTRTGSLGTQQSRSITVNSQSTISTSTEETLNQDINSDEDLYDEIEKVVTKYSASDGLGSFQLETSSVTDDNNMGIKVGNKFYPLADGSLIISKARNTFGDEDEIIECEINGFNYSLVDAELNLWSQDISYSPNAENRWSGEGAMIHINLFSLIDNDIALNDNKQISYLDLFDVYNGATGTSYNSQNGSGNCATWDIDDPLWERIDLSTPCKILNAKYNTSEYRFYDTNFDSNYANNTGGAGLNVDYCLGTQFDHIGKLMEVSKNSGGIYTIKIEGKDKFSLPLKIFYKGYLAIKLLD